MKQSIWQRILDRLSQGLQAISRPQTTDPRNSVAFSIAFLSLAAKLAKADGQVTKDEVAAFRQIFVIKPEDEANAARVFNLCRETTDGFEIHADRMGRLIEQSCDPDKVRSDVMESFFVIAMADGVYHEGEDAFLRDVKDRIGMSDAAFNRVMANYVPECECPYTVLGVGEDASMDDIRAARRTLLRENHPDRMIARGLPEEMVRMGAERVHSIEKAFTAVKAALENNRQAEIACEL